MSVWAIETYPGVSTKVMSVWAIIIYPSVSTKVMSVCAIKFPSVSTLIECDVSLGDHNLPRRINKSDVSLGDHNLSQRIIKQTGKCVLHHRIISLGGSTPLPVVQPRHTPFGLVIFASSFLRIWIGGGGSKELWPESVAGKCDGVDGDPPQLLGFE